MAILMCPRPYTNWNRGSNSCRTADRTDNGINLRFEARRCSDERPVHGEKPVQIKRIGEIIWQKFSSGSAAADAGFARRIVGRLLKGDAVQCGFEARYDPDPPPPPANYQLRRHGEFEWHVHTSY